MTDKVIRGVSCPACGGSLEILEGSVLIRCNFCGTGLMVKGERGIARYFVPLKIAKERILSEAQKWFGKYDKAPDLKKEAKFTEMFPVYVPFWRVTATVIGWVLGDVKKKSNNTTTYEPVERQVNKKYDFTCPACDIGEFGVKWVDLEGDEIRPFDLEEVQKQGMTFGVLTTPTEVLEVCQQKFMQWAESSAGVDRQTYVNLHMIDHNYNLVFYPLWIIRYEYKKRIYQITADAESGQLLYGRAPGNNLYRVACLLGTLFLGNLVLTSEIRGSFHSSDNNIFGIAFLALAFMVFGFWKFRYGGEVRIQQKDKGSTFLDMFSDIKLPGRELKSILEKI